MAPSEYFYALRRLANEKRQQYGITTQKVALIIVKKIYKQEGVKIDYWDVKNKKIRAAYLCDDGDCSVMLNRKLPNPQKLFSLVHELKHHYTDRERMENGEIECGDYNANKDIEIGAEIFAAEFIYPEALMQLQIKGMGITNENCVPKSLIEFKRQAPASISYKFIIKRFEWFGIIKKGQYADVHFQKLEEQLYPPIYKQEWFKRRRKIKQSMLK